MNSSSADEHPVSNVTSPPSFGLGSGKRMKVFLLDKFPSYDLGYKKLPKTEQVFLCLMKYILDDPGRKHHSNIFTLATSESIKSAARKVTIDVKNVWLRHFSSKLIEEKDSKIITEDSKIVEKLFSLMKEWKRLEQDSRRDDRNNSSNFKKNVANFKEKLIWPFDITVKNYADKLKKSGIINCLEDLKYLEQQLSLNQPGGLGSLDTSQVKRDKRKRYEALQLEKRKIKEDERNQTERHVLDVQTVDQNAIEASGDCPYFNDPAYEVNTLRSKKKINVMSAVAMAGMGRNISLADSTVIAAITAKALGVDLENTNISLGSSHYQTKKVRELVAKRKREELIVSDNVAILFDGKMCSQHGTEKRSNRIGVIMKNIGGNNFEEVIAIPETDSGTGKAEAGVVTSELLKLNIKGEVSVLVFDTTSSNTSADVGACHFIELYVEHPVLYAACRKHIHELILGKAKKVLFGGTSSPAESLFHDLKKDWHNLTIDMSQLKILPLEMFPIWFQEEAKKVLSWCVKANDKMTFPRADYKELLQLTIIVLGGQAYLPNYKFHLPGNTSNARWMAKAIYYQKIYLIGDMWNKKKPEKLEQMVSFIAIIYTRYWLMCPLTASAPRHDLELYELVLQYRKIDPSLAFQVPFFYQY